MSVERRRERLRREFREMCDEVDGFGLPNGSSLSRRDDEEPRERIPESARKPSLDDYDALAARRWLRK